MKRVLITLALALPACTGRAAEPDRAQTCTAVVAPPPEFSGWVSSRALTSVAAQARLASATFDTGVAIDLRLHPDGQVTYISLPKGAGEAGSYGGLAQLHVEHAGIYKVGIGDFAWIDLTRDFKPMPTLSFGHGPECTGIKKVVIYGLEAGDYAFEVSGEKAPSLRVIVVAEG